MKNIYIIFNNKDFKPVFVGSSESNTANCIKSVFSNAMNEKKDILSNWVNKQWQNNNEVLFHELHNNLNDDEAKHFEQEWRKNLSNLLKGKSLSKMSEQEEKKPEIPHRMSRVAWPKAKYGLYLASIIVILFLVISYRHLIF